MAEPLIVTAALGDADFRRLDALRRAHFPPERNHLHAHLTMFHALPPSVEAEVRALLAELARNRPPRAMLSSIMDLGGGVAFKVDSPDLADMRELLAERFHGCLTSQDAAGWRPHITIQNKVERKVAAALYDELKRDFVPRPIVIHGLELHRYLGGPWEALGRWPFRG